MKTRPAFLLLLLAIALTAAAQTPDPEPKRSDAPVPTITFDFVFPGAQPAHYAFSVESTGRASYLSDAGKGTDGGEQYTTQFTMSREVRDQIFALAKQANYFKGDFELRKGRIANMGAKTLTYAAGPQTPSPGNLTNGIRNSTTYNYSANPAIQQLTNIFQGIAATLEFGARISHLHRFDRLGLEPELKRMEEMQKNGQLLEIQAIGPVLRSVAEDANVLNVTRQRALRLLRGAQVAAAAQR